MTTSAATRPRLASLVPATLASLAAAAVPLWVAHDLRGSGSFTGFAVFYAVVLAAAGVLILRRSIGAQLFARSVWWSAFGGGTLISLFAAEDGEVAGVALAMVLTTAVALLASGGKGLGGDDRGFAPAAYRGPILVSMIMAFADAQALGWLGASRLYWTLASHAGPSASEVKQASAMLLCALVAVVALWGLYRLRLWGLALSAIATVAIGVLAWTPVLGMAGAGPLPYAFSASAVIQLALLAPLALAIVHRRAPAPPSPRRARLAAIAPAVVIAVLAALSTLTVVTSHSLVRF